MLYPKFIKSTEKFIKNVKLNDNNRVNTGVSNILEIIQAFLLVGFQHNSTIKSAYSFVDCLINILHTNEHNQAGTIPPPSTTATTPAATGFVTTKIDVPQCE